MRLIKLKTKLSKVFIKTLTIIMVLEIFVLTNGYIEPTPAQGAVLSYPNAVQSLSLNNAKTAYYRLSETSGTSIADSSGGSHTGTITTTDGPVTLNQPSLLTNDSDPSALFAGGRVTSTSFMPALTSVTLAAEFKPTAWPLNFRYDIVKVGADSNSGLQAIVYQDVSNVFSYQFYDTSGNGVVFTFPIFEGSHTLNHTYHVAVTHDFVTKTVKMYLDGLLVSTQTHSQDVRSSASQAVYVGNTNVRGYIDEPLVAGDTVLTDTQIRSLMKASVGADQSATEFYVSPTGNSRNPGTEDAPLDLYTAFRSGLAAPGEEYLLMDGTYNAPAGSPTLGFYVYAGGNSSDSVYFKESPGARAIIDAVNMPLGPDQAGTASGNIVNIQSNYVQLWDFEITNSNADTANNRALSRHTSVAVIGDYVKLIGLWVYDSGQAVFASEAAGDLEMHGNLFFNNGWWSNNGSMVTCGSGSCDPSGHNIYIQSDDTVHRKLLKNSVIWGAADFNYHGYGQSIAALRGLDIEDTIAFSTGMWHTTTNGSTNYGFVPLDPVGDITLKNSVAYSKVGGSYFTLGRAGDPHRGAVVTGNKFFGRGRGSFIDFSHVTFSNNLMVDTRPSASGGNNWLFTYIRPAAYVADPEHVYDTTNKGYWTGIGNTYAGFDYSSSKQIWNEDGVSSYTLPTWQSLTGTDLDATIRDTTTNPYLSPNITYYADDYRVGHGFAAVYNPTAAASINLNLSSFGLVDGQSYEIRDTMNPFVTLASGSYSASSPNVSTAMTGTDVQTPIGYTIIGTAAERTSSEFKTFVIIPGSVSADLDPPTFTVNNGTATGPVQSDTINVTINDASSIDSSEYGYSSNNVCNGSDTYGNSFTSAVNFAVAGDHTDYLCVKATDSESNTGYQLVGQLNTDNTAAVRSAGSPSGTLAFGTTGTTLSLTTSESATCKYGTVSGTAYVSLPSTFSTTGTTSHSQSLSGLTNDTSYIYYVRCQDIATNANSTDYAISFSVAGDTEDPTVSITAPSNNATVSGSSVSLTASASDNDGIAGVTFYYDTSNQIGVEDITSTYGVTWNTTAVSDGTHTLTAVARDNTSNTTTSASILVTVDNTAPVRSNGSPSGTLSAGTTSTNLSLITNENATCKYGTLANAIYSAIASTFGTTGTTSHTQNLTGLTNGTSYTYYVRCQDQSSNANSSDYTISFSVASSSSGGGGGGGSSGGGSSNPPSTPTPSPSTPPASTRLINSSGTYYLVENGVRKGVTSPGILYSCGFEFKDAGSASSSDLTLPTAFLLPCGGALVKSAEDPTVYLISSGRRYGFTSASVFTGLGFNFNSVLLVTNPELQALPKGDNLQSPTQAHLPNTDININGTIYWISPSLTKHPYPSLEVWNSWHKDGDFSTVVPANQNDLNLPTGGMVSLRTF